MACLSASWGRQTSPASAGVRRPKARAHVRAAEALGIAGGSVQGVQSSQPGPARTPAPPPALRRRPAAAAAAARLQAPLAVPPVAVPQQQEEEEQQQQHEAAAAGHAPAIQPAQATPSSGGGPVEGGRPHSPPPSAPDSFSIAETSRPSIDIGSLLSGSMASMASMLSSHDAAEMGGSWGSRDEAGSGSGALPSGMEASWEYSGPRSFPMLAVVRLEHIKHALLLGAVDTGIGGIVIAGGHGVAKSVLARSLIELLPPIEVAAASWCNADPDRPEDWEDGLEERLAGSAPARAVRPAPFVTVPLGVTEDRLLGTVDVEASMREGRPVFMPGLLAQCHRGVLYVDDMNLLDEGICSLLLSAVAAGRNTVEREGISVSHPCAPLLIATYNPEEGELREGVLDRFAIGLSADIEYGVEARVQAVLAAERFQDARPAVLSETEWGTEQLKLAVLAARETLPDVCIAEKHVRFLVEQAARLGCQGQRAEVFAAKVSRAAAALRGSDRVEAPDLQTAVQLAILPRTTLTEPQVVQQQRPPPPPQAPKEQRDEEDSENEDQRDQQQPPPPEEQQIEAPAEFMVGVQDVALDPGVLFFALQQKRLRGRSGRSRSVVFSQDRGRYVKPMIPKGKVRRLAVDATLRAAAPYQLSRRRRAAAAGKPARKIYIDQDDLRAKRLARKSRCLVLFVVDASGSMALNRMAAAKGAALRLLGQSYVSRDYVAVLPFHGEQAEVLVPPSRAIALAKRRLEVLPCGGGTPLAHALSLACRMGTNAQQKGEVGRCLVVLITDGRANVSLACSNKEPGSYGPDATTPEQEVLNGEVLDMARRLGASGVKLLVIDTESRYISRGFAKEIAAAAGGRYHRLPNAIDAVSAISAAAGAAVAQAKA